MPTQIFTTSQTSISSVSTTLKKLDLKGCNRQQFVGAALLFSLPMLSSQVGLHQL